MMHIMDIKLGTLEFSPALTRHDLLATPVRAALESLEAAGSVGVAAIDGALSDTAAFCEAYEVGMSAETFTTLAQEANDEAARSLEGLLAMFTLGAINAAVWGYVIAQVMA
jgi:hypothetical protein